jgi:hypothetical protein
MLSPFAISKPQATSVIGWLGGRDLCFSTRGRLILLTVQYTFENAQQGTQRYNQSSVVCSRVWGSTCTKRGIAVLTELVLFVSCWNARAPCISQESEVRFEMGCCLASIASLEWCYTVFLRVPGSDGRSRRRTHAGVEEASAVQQAMCILSLPSAFPHPSCLCLV